MPNSKFKTNKDFNKSNGIAWKMSHIELWNESAKLMMDYENAMETIKCLRGFNTDKALFEENQKLKNEIEQLNKEMRVRGMGWLPSDEKIKKQEMEELLQENQKLKKYYKKLVEAMEANKELFEETEELKQEKEELFQEKQELKKELESLKQFELDRILDASMCEIFTTERQFLRESMIL